MKYKKNQKIKPKGCKWYYCRCIYPTLGIFKVYGPGLGSAGASVDYCDELSAREAAREFEAAFHAGAFLVK
jgi:hypothetical protein